MAAMRSTRSGILGAAPAGTHNLGADLHIQLYPRATVELLLPSKPQQGCGAFDVGRPGTILVRRLKRDSLEKQVSGGLPRQGRRLSLQFNIWGK